jgi:hypothetical protein
MIPINDEKALLDFLDRRHPEYWGNVVHWEFLQACYEGGRDWFKENIFRYLKEGDKEFKDRLARAYRFNHTREIVELINRYVFKGKINRSDDADQVVKDFWKLAGRTGGTIDDVLTFACTKSSTQGRCYLVIDSTKRGDVQTVADEKKADIRVYSYVVSAEDMLDISFDSMGNINWALVRESWRDDSDPLRAADGVDFRYRLWEKNDWQLFQIHEEGKGRNRKRRVEEIGRGSHSLGVVPIIPVNHIKSDDKWTAPALVGDIAYLDRACANYLSNLDAIIQDQTFSQLVMPAQGMMPGEDGYAKLIEMGTKRIFTYNGESPTAPSYISPDPKQATVIIEVINKIISEIYHMVGMAGERTKQDNSMGIDNSSGVAKAYDFERMNALLVAKAAALAQVENKVVELVCLWRGAKPPKDALVSYPESFDVRGLYDEFEIATNLQLLEAPDSVQQEQMKALISKIFPRLTKALREKMEQELKSWPPEEEVVDPAAGVKAPKENRQGQVTE